MTSIGYEQISNEQDRDSVWEDSIFQAEIRNFALYLFSNLGRLIEIQT